MAARYHIDLTFRERTELKSPIGGRRQPVRRIRSAQILLATAAGVGVGAATCTGARSN